MEKILTIVIPTYNMQDYLRRCLDSLIVPEEQMMQLEVLVVNDGSKDNSSVIAHDYQDKYPGTFRVIDKGNGNYGSCVNRGLQEATGKYIKILDADDSFDNSAFGEYLTFLGKSDVDLIVNDFCFVNENNDITGVRVYDLPTEESIFTENTRKIFNKKNFQMHAAAYKLQKVLSLGYKQTEGISYTDQEWIYTPLMSVNTIAYFGKILYRYLLGRTGQTMNQDALKKGIGQNQQCVLRILADYVNPPQINNRSVHYYISDQAVASLYSIYSKYLLQYKDIELDGLMSFEKKLESINPNLISLADKINLKGTFFPYVRYWHKHKRRPRGLWFNLCYLYSRIYNRIDKEK